MIDPRYTQLAKILTQYSIKVKKGQHIHVQCIGIAALPLAREAVKEVWRLGAHPYLDVIDDTLSEYFYSVATKEHLEKKPAVAQFITKWSDSSIIIVGDENSRSLAHTDPHKMLKRQVLMKHIREMRLNKPCVLTDVPTNELAKHPALTPKPSQ